jgi:hypothetical protein
LHEGARGTVIVWDRLKEVKQWLKLEAGAGNVRQILAEQLGGDDRYMTVNEFHGWRTIHQLKSLRALFLDIDGCTDLDVLLEALRAAAMPPPTAVVFSGRGYHFYWLHESKSAHVLPVWQDCQNKLIKLMTHVGADPAARDCARVLRFAGSVNTKNGEKTYGIVFDEKPWNFHDLCDAILGKREKYVQPSERDTHKPKPGQAAIKATVRDITTARAERGHRPRSGSIYARWYLVYQDLGAIAKFYGKAGIPEGHRHTWMFLTAVALSWFAQPDAIADELILRAKIWAPGQTDSEIRSALKQPLERARMASKGIMKAYNGKDEDARFKYKRKTLFGLLEKIIPAELAPKLRAIVSDEVRAIHKKETTKAHDEKRGPRAKRDRDRVADGRHKKSHADSLEAMAPWDALGISRATYYRQRAAGTLPTYQARARGRSL